MTSATRLHLGGPYAITLCRLPLGEERAQGNVWPKGSTPTEGETCEACWAFFSIVGEVFGGCEERDSR